MHPFFRGQDLEGLSVVRGQRCTHPFLLLGRLALKDLDPAAVGIGFQPFRF